MPKLPEDIPSVPSIGYGAVVRVTDALGRTSTRRALSGVMMGEDFPVVWTCRDTEWESATRAGKAPQGVPWPAEDVVPEETLP